jgi:putative ABC transport system permease protein
LGKFLLTGRLVARDLRHRPAQALLLLLAITASTAVLSLGLVLHGVSSQPYQQTRAATNGPDVVAELTGQSVFGVAPHRRHRGQPAPGAPGSVAPGPVQTVAAQVKALTRAPGVSRYSGPYPVASALLRVGRITAAAEVEGRTQTPASVDQPKVTAGTWVRSGGIVLERTFAEALGVGVGDRVTLDGRPYLVVGTAVTAANPPFPNMCYPPGGDCDFDLQGDLLLSSPGLAWATEPDATSLASANAPLSYALNLKLKDPAAAPAFASTYSSGPFSNEPSLTAWQDIETTDGQLVLDEQQVLSPGALLAALLAVATVAVLAGGRMAEHTRRIGLLKAVGGTPGLVGLVLLAENVVLALLAAAAGLMIGWLAAPLIASPGAGLVGTPGGPSMTLPIAAEVTAVAMLVALAATLVPALRASRTSTISALADAARRPRRGALLIRLSRRLPVPLLLGLRLVARRPRRAVLTAASMAVTVTGVVAVLAFHATAHVSADNATGLSNPVLDRDEQMLAVLTVVLLTLSALNAICGAWATVLDTRQASALSRALGATPRQVSAAVAVAQAAPALPGAVLGVPLGIELFKAASHAHAVTNPSVLPLLAAVAGTLVAVAVLAAIPARIGVRIPAARILQAE